MQTCGLFLGILGIINNVNHAPSNREHQFLIFARLECHPHRITLPDWRRTFRVRIVFAARFANIFFQHRLAASDLGDDRIKLLAVFGDAAIRDVISIPTGCRIEGIKLR